MKCLAHPLVSCNLETSQKRLPYQPRLKPTLLERKRERNGLRLLTIVTKNSTLDVAMVLAMPLHSGQTVFPSSLTVPVIPYLSPY